VKFKDADTMRSIAEERDRLVARVAQLEAALRVGMDVVNGEYQTPHPDEWIRATHEMLELRQGIRSGSARTSSAVGEEK
jgi:hypothetical protein